MVGTNKQCNECLLIKPILEFYAHKTNKDGYFGKCKNCSNNYSKTWRNNNKKRHNELCKQWNINNKDKKLKNDKQWKINNREHCNNYNKQRYLNNPDYQKKFRVQWKKNNPHKLRQYNRKRRELKKVNEYKFKIEHETYIYEIFQSQCFKCGNLKDLTLDHYIPLSKGGQLELGNVVLLCRSCNSSKWKHDAEKFYTLEERIRLKCYYEIKWDHP